MKISLFFSYPFVKAPLCFGGFERLPAADFRTGACSIMAREDKVYLILCTLGGLHWHRLKGLEFQSLHIHKVLVFRFNIMYFFLLEVGNNGNQQKSFLRSLPFEVSKGRRARGENNTQGEANIFSA